MLENFTCTYSVSQYIIFLKQKFIHKYLLPCSKFGFLLHRHLGFRNGALVIWPKIGSFGVFEMTYKLPQIVMKILYLQLVLFQRFILFLNLFVCICVCLCLCMPVWVCAHDYSYLERPEASASLNLKLIDSCELPDVGPGSFEKAVHILNWQSSPLVSTVYVQASHHIFRVLDSLFPCFFLTL